MVLLHNNLLSNIAPGLICFGAILIIRNGKKSAWENITLMK